MSVGLYDMDFMTYRKVPLNLEIMKLSNFYKKKGEIVKLSPKIAPNMYSKFIMRQDYENGVFSRKIFEEPDLEYGGLAFTSGKYIPLPIEIEEQPADTSIYRSVISRGEQMKDAGVYEIPPHLPQLNMTHLRLSLDGKTIWNNYQKQIPVLEKTQTFMFHDPNIGRIEGALEEIKKLKEMAHTEGLKSFGRAATKFPLVLYNSADLSAWTGVFNVAELSPVQYFGVLEDEDFINFFENTVTKDRCLQFEYIVGDLEQNEKRCIDKLPNVYRQMLFAKSKRKKFQLKYDEKTFSDPRWCRVIVMMNCFQQLPYGTMLNFARYISNEGQAAIIDEMITKDEARELFAFVREESYELFKMFYEVNSVIIKGGKLYDYWK